MFRVEQPKCLMSEDFDNVITLLKCKKSDLVAVAPEKIYSNWKGHSKYKTAVLLKTQGGWYDSLLKAYHPQLNYKLFITTLTTNLRKWVIKSPVFTGREAGAWRRGVWRELFNTLNSNVGAVQKLLLQFWVLSKWCADKVLSKETFKHHFFISEKCDSDECFHQSPSPW